jgi:membrane-associated phospholipid phosphatase
MWSAAWILSAAVAVHAATAPPHATPTPTQVAAPAPPSGDPWPDSRPIVRLLPNLWNDLRALPNPTTAWILAAGGGGAILAHQTDQRVADWVADAGTTSFTTLGRNLGTGWVQGGAAVAVYAVGKVSRHPEATHVGGDLIRAQVANGLVTTAIKVAADRDRPNGGHYAFPSGHTSATFASAAVLQSHYGWKVGIPSYAVASFVGWTRVRDQAHWLSDVVFGAALGTMAGHTVTLGHRTRWIVTPAPMNGGLAIVVTRVR